VYSRLEVVLVTFAVVVAPVKIDVGLSEKDGLAIALHVTVAMLAALHPSFSDPPEVLAVNSTNAPA
jgi:hypothetical protein